VVERHAGFEAKNLASAEWFHPRGDTSAHWLRVTAAMARRCLKHTTVEEYCESIDESSLPVQFVSEGIERGEP
jgi:crotonobetainyl-CoA:carnitine CoA-transferase CaiB-like acyl-CoA transferase